MVWVLLFSVFKLERKDPIDEIISDFVNQIIWPFLKNDEQADVAIEEVLVTIIFINADEVVNAKGEHALKRDFYQVAFLVMVDIVITI